MIKAKTSKRAPSVLGLTLIDGQLRACHMTRAKSGLEVVKATQAALTLDVLHPEAELVGREIKNHLDAAGIRERHVIVGLPPRWVMTQQTKLPDLAPEDANSFLQIEAEKGFPVDPAELQIARSFQRSPAGTHVTQLAVRSEQVAHLTGVLKAAGLKPVSFALGLAELPGAVAPAGQGRITVAADAAGVRLLVSAGGGVAAFRTCEATIESENGEKLMHAASVARELRITFEQVPAELRSDVKELYLTGDTALVRQLADSLGDWAKAAGLKVSRGDLPEKSLAAEMTETLAKHWLEVGAVELDFLPPRPSRWALFMARYSSKRLATSGFIAAGVAALVLLAFVWLEVRRWSLRSEWAGMQTQVRQLEGVKDKIKEFRPFFDTSFRNLSIMKRVTECFPENGSVTARSFEAHGTLVTISGTARDNASLLRVQEQLRKAKEVSGLKIEQIRGKTPMQFTLTFRWLATSGT